MAEHKEAPITRWLSADKVKVAVARVLPKHLTPERLIQIATIAITKSEILQRCTPLSIVQSVVEASELGLSLEPGLGQAYLVPYFNSKIGGFEAQMIPGYRGLVHLARNGGLVKNVLAEVVRAQDEFDIEFGTSRTLRHKPKLTALKRYDEDTWVGSYAVADYMRTEMLPDFVYLERELVLKIRMRSKAFNPGGDKKASGPWVTDPEEMWKKTAIRRLCKSLPQATELRNMHRAAQIEEARDIDIDVEPIVDLSDLASLNPPATAGALTEGESEGPKRKAKQEPAETKPSEQRAEPAPAEPEQPGPKLAQKIDAQAFYAIAADQSIAAVDLKQYVVKKYNVPRGIIDLNADQAKELERELTGGAVLEAIEAAQKAKK